MIQPSSYTLIGVLASSKLNVPAVLPVPLEGLATLADNLRWSWREETRNLFRDVDPALWEANHENPKHVLQQVSASRLAQLADDAQFVARIQAELKDLEDYQAADLWFQKTYPEVSGPVVAYYSMEFGIDPALPIYSGGLGVLAGDHLKSASDLGLPLIAVGLLYSYGYFKQSLSSDGWQQETYNHHEPADLPVVKVLDPASGEQLRVKVQLAGGREATATLWKAQVGRIPLLLLDTNIPENDHDPALREITDKLYGGDPEHRIQQELVLGVGGVRAVNLYCDTFGLQRPPVAHLNEGHAGFLGMERIREHVHAGCDFETALAKVRAGSIFTTHTPVPAGIDRFDIELVRRYLSEPTLFPELDIEKAMRLGAENDPDRFNMAHMGLRLAQRANGVAKLHGEVSRSMFRSLYPGYEPDGVPIGHVTNGVHLPTWLNPKMLDVIATLSHGADLPVDNEWTGGEVANEELWAVRNEMRADLIAAARNSLHTSWRQRGHDEAQLAWTRRVLDPNVLTIGFARRVATYKRLTLMLRDRDRLRSILCNEKRPVQFVIAGKAHPHDEGGKQLMQELVKFADEAGVRDRFIFLPDYDIRLAGKLVSGADIWLNNPIRPQEASGTSGMKAVMNGCLTLSISDGWWDEMPKEGHGWTIPTVHSNDSGYRDYLESQALYDLIENEIAPLFYDRDDNGLPQRWLELVKTSIVDISPKVMATRMVRDYTNQYYLPSFDAAAAIADAADAKAYVAWQQQVRSAWHDVAVVATAFDVKADEAGKPAQITVNAEVDLGQLSGTDVKVEALIGRIAADGNLVTPEAFELSAQADGKYVGTIDRDQPGEWGVTVRIVPAHKFLANPAELGLIRY